MGFLTNGLEYFARAIVGFYESREKNLLKYRFLNKNEKKTS